MRYATHFGGLFGWEPLSTPSLTVPTIYWGLLLYAALSRVMRRDRGRLFFVVGTLATLLFMCIAIGNKRPFYLVWILPLYTSVAAIGVESGLRRMKPIPLIMAATLLLAQGTAITGVLRIDSYHTEYAPVVSWVRHNIPREAMIAGTPALLFGVPDYHLIEDSRLNSLSGRMPDYIVADGRYTSTWCYIYPRWEPRAAALVRSRLEAYEAVFRRGEWIVMRRRPERGMQPINPPAQSPENVPWVCGKPPADGLQGQQK